MSRAWMVCIRTSVFLRGMAASFPWLSYPFEVQRKFNSVLADEAQKSQTRHMKALFPPFAAGVVLLLGSLVSATRADIGYQFGTVGNPGNANDSATGSVYGAVNYVYDIGTYDVTLNQYTVFLNAVANSDLFNLYDTDIATDPNVSGIARNGSGGSYSYAVIGSGNRPVTYVSWFNARRFANWMQNGQPTCLGEV